MLGGKCLVLDNASPRKTGLVRLEQAGTCGQIDICAGAQTSLPSFLLVATAVCAAVTGISYVLMNISLIGICKMMLAACQICSNSA